MSNVADATSREKTMTPDEAARRVAMARNAVVSEVQKVIVGHEDLIEFLLIALFSTQERLKDEERQGQRGHGLQHLLRFGSLSRED